MVLPISRHACPVRSAWSRLCENLVSQVHRGEWQGDRLPGRLEGQAEDVPGDYGGHVRGHDQASLEQETEVELNPLLSLQLTKTDPFHRVISY